MKVALPPELERFVQEQVTSGRFPTTDAVVQTAIAALRAQDEANRTEFEALQDEIALGIEQLERGEGLEFSTESLPTFFADIKRRGRERRAAERERNSQSSAQ